MKVSVDYDKKMNDSNRGSTQEYISFYFIFSILSLFFVNTLCF